MSKQILIYFKSPYSNTATGTGVYCHGDDCFNVTDFFIKGIFNSKKEILQTTENFINNEISVTIDFDRYKESKKLNVNDDEVLSHFNEWLNSIIKGSAKVETNFYNQIREERTSHTVDSRKLLYWLFILNLTDKSEISINNINV